MSESREVLLRCLTSGNPKVRLAAWDILASQMSDQLSDFFMWGADRGQNKQSPFDRGDQNERKHGGIGKAPG